MEYLYIDESGTMTNKNIKEFPYFIICVIRVLDKRKLKSKIKRFISNNIVEIKLLNSSKMFRDGKFIEIKGSELTPQLKTKFVKYLCKEKLFEVFYIDVLNSAVEDRLYVNKARAFNYLIDLFLRFSIRKKLLPKGDYNIHIDERNVKTNAKKTLEDYIATELGIKEKYINDITVEYNDSSTNTFIQLSDFFSNLYYSFKMNESFYQPIINMLKEKEILKNIFVFPENKTRKIRIKYNRM